MKLKPQIMLPIACCWLSFALGFFALGFLISKPARREVVVRTTNGLSFTNGLTTNSDYIGHGATNGGRWGRLESNSFIVKTGDDSEPKPTIEFKFMPQSELLQSSRFSNAPSALLAQRFQDALKSAKLGWMGRVIWDDFTVVSNMVWESVYLSDEQFNRIYGTNTSQAVIAMTNRAPANLRIISVISNDLPYTWRGGTNVGEFWREFTNNYMKIQDEPRPYQFDNQQRR